MNEEKTKSIMKIGVIIVLYNTTFLTSKLESQFGNITFIIIDNTPNQNLNINRTNLIYHPMMRNAGIAAAQNKGIEIATTENCTHVVFLDQDSELQPNFITDICTEYARINTFCPNLFILGSTIFNGRTSEEYKSKIHKDKSIYHDFIPRRDIISSGSCASIETIKQVGPLDESLFIDYVDLEWGWRGANMGLISGITPRVKLTHFIGKTEYNFFKLLVIVSSPVRYYYQTRNYIKLIKRSYVPFKWKINIGIKKILFLMTYPFKVKDWKSIYKNTFKGFVDGVFNDRT